MKTRKLVTLALLTTVAMMLSYVEAMLPSLGVPGVKMGLANIVVIFALYRFGAKDAALISILRVLLNGLLFTNPSAVVYSLAGAVLSLLGMILLKRLDVFSSVGVSVAGGVMHNAGQILMAVILMGTAQIAYYLPVLVITGTVTGVLIGLVSALVINRVKKI